MSVDIEMLNAEAEIKKERCRSYVRIVVTYAFAATYLIGAIVLIIYFLKYTNNEVNALSVFSGLSTAALGVVGFWFGGRKLQPSEDTNPQNPQNPGSTNGSGEDKVKNISNPATAAITAEISSATLMKLKSGGLKSHPVNANESKTKQMLIGETRFDDRKLTFAFDKVKTKSGTALLKKPLVGSLRIPDINQPISAGREILLSS